MKKSENVSLLELRKKYRQVQLPHYYTKPTGKEVNPFASLDPCLSYIYKEHLPTTKSIALT